MQLQQDKIVGKAATFFYVNWCKRGICSSHERCGHLYACKTRDLPGLGEIRTQYFKSRQNRYLSYEKNRYDSSQC